MTAQCDCLVPILEGVGNHAPNCAVFRPPPHKAKHTTARGRRTITPPQPDITPARFFARINAIDLSLTSTGLATYHRQQDTDPIVRSITYTVKVPNTATIEAREHRIRYMVDNVELYLGTADLIIIEGASHGSVGGHAWDRAGAWWQIVRTAIACGCPVVQVAPTARAKWATGNGRSDKAAVAAAMTRRLPTISFNNSDEADAAALGYMAAQQLGWLPGTKAELDALRSVNWPKGVHA